MMNTRVSIWRNALRMLLALALAATAVPFVAPDKAHAEQAADGAYHISTAADLLYTVSLTRAAIGQSVDIVLDNDLTLTEADLTVAKQYGGLIFGTIDLPFKGTFDGQGHTIKGLKYDRELFTPKANTGLFASTDGAIIKNLTLEDAYIGADFRGGVLVGRAACWAASSPARRTEASSTTARCAAAGACRTRRPPSPRWAAKGCTWARW